MELAGHWTLDHRQVSLARLDAHGCTLLSQSDAFVSVLLFLVLHACVSVLQTARLVPGGRNTWFAHNLSNPGNWFVPLFVLAT